MASAAPTATATEVRRLGYELDEGLGARAKIGLITLSTDQVIEHEFFGLLRLPDVAVWVNRLYYNGLVDEPSLRAMERGLKDAASLIVPSVELDVVAFGCTSGAMYIGEETVAARVREAHPGVACTLPMTAALAAFRAFGAARIALLTPYADEITRAMRRFIEDCGVGVPVAGGYGILKDTEIARVSPESIRRSVLELGRSDDVDAVFVSCTAMRAAAIIPELERELIAE
jgi:maleate isomerase